MLFRSSAIILSLAYMALSEPTAPKPRSLYDLSPYEPGSNLPYGTYFNTLEQPYYPPNANCIDYSIPIQISWDSFDFTAQRWTNDLELADFFTVQTTRQPGPIIPPALSSTSRKVNGSYTIAATFCSPKNATAKAKTVILATHGIAPARAHWNSPYKPDEYNFVQHAVAQGYSVFFYDRLGCGASTKYVKCLSLTHPLLPPHSIPHPLTPTRLSGFTTNLSTAISVLRALAALVRKGSYTGPIGIPSKLALLGFSFGSYTTHGALSLDPTIADAVILTAIGFNKTGINVKGLLRSYAPRIAAVQNPFAFGDRDEGYLTWADATAQAWNYFKFPNYEVGALAFAEVAKEPFAVAEFLTLLGGPINVDKYTGPALHITGEFDYIFGDGDIKGIFEEPAKTIYKNAKLELVVQPGASHNIGLHRNASKAFQVITGFLERAGL